MHNVPYSRYPGYQKTIEVVRSQFFCPGIKNDAFYYIVRCMECQRVKAEHRHRVGLLHPLPIPEKKWEVVTINFITKFPRTTRQHDLIMVLVDKLKKDAHFVPIKTTHIVANIAEIYMKEIVRLHGIPRTIISYRDTQFTSNLSRGLFQGFGTNMNFITTYHP
jgi:hypothetical protein